jgi:uncharacterized protein YbjT (DUF2867 family)
MTDGDTLLAEAILGRDAEEFLASELGRYLVGRAEQEEREAVEQLARVSSWRRRRIRELQDDIWRARSVRQWLAEMVSAGRAAEPLLEQMRAEAEE